MTASAPAPAPVTSRFVGSILLRTAALLLILNLAFGLFDPLPALARWSAYNSLFPGRLRLPYGDEPSQDYNLSPFSLEAMIASHEIAGVERAPTEFRVLVLGDSSVWGYLLHPDETVAAQLNRSAHTLADGRRLRAFNLGYPIMSLTKDLLILQQALPYEPDLVIWLVTLESFPRAKQLYPPLLQHNAPTVRHLIETYDLDLDPYDPRLVEETFLERTLVGRRRALADLVRLQLYGVLWAATGIDQAIPETYTPRMEDLPADDTYQEFAPGELTPQDLAFDILRAAHTLASPTPILIVNEPMFVSRGANSDIRYNFYYPRWAYDAYRQWLSDACLDQGWHCLDLWQALPPSEFTDSAIHYTPAGAQALADSLAAWIRANGVPEAGG